jgi:8-amino-7-oxononanoate synthase
MRMISGPQGPRVVVDGRPVLLLSSHNALGLANHSRVREAAADAALRWGVGAGGSRLAAGSMTVHRRLEDRLADFHQTETALLFGAGYLASLGVIGALAGPGQVIFSDALNHDATVDGCRLCGAETVTYEHGDADHLEWCLRQHPGRDAVIVTDGVFAADGDVAPLAELGGLARRHGAQLVVDESHAVGTLGPGGRGAAADAGIEDAVLIGSLAKALGGFGAYVACDAITAEAIATTPAFARSTAPAPPAVAAAMAALELVQEDPRRIDKLAANADVLRQGLAREGFDVTGSATHIVTLVVGDDADAHAIAEAALSQGVYIEVLADPARLRLCVMASHTRSELAEAARVIGRAALLSGVRPATLVPVAEAQAEVVPLRRAA